MDARSTPESPAQDPARRSPTTWPLLVLLALVTAIHGFVIANEPEPTMFEDEPHYAEYAYIDAAKGDTSLLPGDLRFSQRPELISRIWSQFVQDEDLADLSRNDIPAQLNLPNQLRWLRYRDRGAALERRGRWMNLGLLLILVWLTCLQARALGLGVTASIGAAAGVGLFPWVGFYVHTLWAEVLHATLLGVTFLVVIQHTRGTGQSRLSSARALGALVLGGLTLGAALLTKGTMNAFVPSLAAIVFVTAFVKSSSRGMLARVGRALLPTGALLIGVAAIVGPQLQANAASGHGYRIAGNRWKNLEMGLALEPRELQTDEQRVDRTRLHLLYMDAGENYEERESQAEERTRNLVADAGLLHVAREQFRKLRSLLFRTPSFFERALVERWGESPPAWLSMMKVPGRCMWFALLALGLTGAIRFFRRSPGFVLLALFVAYFGAAALVIPYKVRFLIPLVPTLALLSAATIEGAVRRLRRAA